MDCVNLMTAFQAVLILGCSFTCGEIGNKKSPPSLMRQTMGAMSPSAITLLSLRRQCKMMKRELGHYEAAPPELCA